MTWITFVVWVIPLVIHQAYDGRSIRVLNDLISGQATHGVEYYVDRFRRYAVVATVLLAGMFAAVAWVLKARPGLRSGAGHFWARWLDQMAPLSNRDIVALTIVFALLGGLTEASATYVRYWAFNETVGYSVSTDIFWLAPMAATVCLAGLAIVGLLVRRVLRADPRSGVFLVGLLAALAVYSAGSTLHAGIHPAALATLALGVAYRAGSGIARANTGRLRVARRMALWGGVAVMGWALLTPLRTARQSRRAVASADGRPTGTATADSAPNVVLLVWDTARARSLSLYGYEHPTTPFLEQFASRASTFEAAVSTSSWTLPSHASLLTGRFHHEHLADRNTPLDSRFPTIAQALHDRGYRTGGFVANTFWLGRGFGIDRGFEWYQDYADISSATLLDAWWLSQQMRRTVRLRRGDYRMTDRLTAADIQGRFLSWVDRDDRRPFFAFLNVFDAHEPYYPPGDFGFPFAHRPSPVYHWNFNRAIAHSPEELTDLRDSYDSCIRYLDSQLEALVKALETRGLMRNTIIIITADHGETIGDHENTLIGHENSVYFDVLQVPLVIYVPSRAGGTRVTAPVSLADVPHTIVDLISAPHASNPFPGRTLMPAAAPTTGTTPLGDAEVARPILSQANPAKYHQNISRWPIHDGPLFSAVEDRWHYVINAKGQEQLFDLARDPWERMNLAGGAADSVTADSASTSAHGRLRTILAPVVTQVMRSR